jgi:hypothetical protein
MGAGKLLDAKLAVPAVIPAAGQKAVSMMSNQKLALSQVFPLGPSTLIPPFSSYDIYTLIFAKKSRETFT